MPSAAAAIDDPFRMRSAGRDLLSLALIDARNLTLRWLTAFEDGAASLQPATDVDPPRWLVGHAGWFQEYWVGRHLQRQRGEEADAGAPRLPSIEPFADDCFDPRRHGRAARWQVPLPDGPTLRQYLGQTLETTLDLLSGVGDSDRELYVFRLALRREDHVGEALAAAAQALQLQRPKGEAPWLALPARPVRDALWMPAQRVRIGSAPGGFVPDNERWAHEVEVPEFEIDAQAVNWARYAEFVEDGGYDEARWWSDAGWRWLQAGGRRVPRYVEQMRQSVLVSRQGQMQRVPGLQAAVHVSRHEAEAWCRWAGRRLPAEVEWELAARGAGPRGFVWGDVFEWCAGSARPWPGHGASTAPGFDPIPAPGTLGVLRGASWMSRPRCRHPAARRFAAFERDELFSGFRSCAL